MDRKRRVGLLPSARSLAGGVCGGVGVGGGAEDMPDPHQHQPPGPGYGRLPPAADTKAQALPGVYIVHAAPLFPVPLDGETVASKKAGPDYKWSSRMSPPGPGSKDPDNKLPSWSHRLSARAKWAKAGSEVRAAKERRKPQSIQAARLRGGQTSLVDNWLSSGTSGPGPGPGHGLLGVRKGVQYPGYGDSIGEELLRCMQKTLMPMMMIFVLYAAIPVQFNPLRISVHPLRSTLLYVVVVQTCVALSAHHVISSNSGLLHAHSEDSRGLDERLIDITTVVEVSATVINLAFWIELPRASACRFDFSYFAKNYGHMVGAQPFRLWRRVMPWISVVFTVGFAPIFMYVWMVYILKVPLLANIPSHLFVACHLFTILVFFAEVSNMIRDLASAVASALKEELDAGRMTASRLEEFRLAWISLRQLTTDLGSVPLTGLSLLLYLLVMNTLAAYQCAVSYHNNKSGLFLACILSFTVLQLPLIYISDVAHRLQDAMSTGFCEPLESNSWRNSPADLHIEHQQFLHTMSTNPAVVTFGGVVNISRSTYLNIMAAIATYLVVLLQLRRVDEYQPTAPLTLSNATVSNLDSVFRSRT